MIHAPMIIPEHLVRLFPEVFLLKPIFSLASAPLAAGIFALVLEAK